MAGTCALCDQWGGGGRCLGVSYVVGVAVGWGLV